MKMAYTTKFSVNITQLITFEQFIPHGYEVACLQE